MPRRPRRSALLLSLLLSATIAGLFAGGVRSSHAAQAAAPPGAGQAVAPSGRPAAGSIDLSRIWWNRPDYVKALDLTATQRAAMDQLMTEQLASRRSRARDYVELRQTLGDQLAAGDWDAAEATAATIGERVGAIARGEGELALGVTRLLAPAQRQKLASDYPALLHRPWLRGGTAGRRSFARPDGARQPSGKGPGGAEGR